MQTSEQQTAPRPGRWRSWAKRFALGVGVLFLLLAGALVFVLSSLDAPWLKGWLQSEVRQAANLEVDWGHAQLSLLSGLVLEDVHVRSPVELRAVSPDFVHVGRLEAGWSVRRLLGSEGPLLDTLSVQTLEVTAITDVQRGTTTGLLWPETPPPAVKPPPGPGLSSTLHELFAGRPIVAVGRVEGAKISWRKIDHDEVVDEASVSGLGLKLEGWRAHLGSDEAPLELTALKHHAALTVGLDVAATPTGATLHAEADIQSQDFEPALQLSQLLRLDGNATFHTAQHALTLAITEAKLLDGAADATAGLERGDDGALVLRQADAHVDVVHAAQDATALGVPLSAAGGTLELKARGVRALPLLALEPKGELSLALTAVDLRQGQGHLAKGTVKLQLSPSASLAFSARLDGLAYAAASVRTLGLEGTAAQATAGWHGQVDVTASDVVPSAQARLARVDLVAKIADLAPVSGAPVPVSGRVDVTGTINGSAFSSGSLRGELGDLRLSLEAATNGHPPFAARAELEGHLRLAGADAVAMFDGPARIEVKASELEPSGPTGAAEATVTLADAVLKLDAHKTAGAAQVEATLDAKSLALLQPLVALPAGWKVEWARASASLTTHLQADALDSAHPRLTHATTVDLNGLEATSPQGPVSLPSLQLVLDAHGTSQAHAGTLTLDCKRCAMGPAKLAQERVVATFDLDRQLPRASVQLDAKGSNGPDVHGVVSAAYVKKEDRTQVFAELTLGRLVALAPLLDKTPGDAFDLENLAAALHARGSLAGKDLSPQTLSGSAEAEIKGLIWEQGDRSLDVPELALTAKIDSSDAGQQLSATAITPHLQAEVAENTATLSGLAVALEGQLARGSLAANAKLDLSIKDVVQDFAPSYAVGGVKVLAAGGRDTTGLLTLSRSTVVNEAAGTSMWIEGAMVPDATHPKARAQLELSQDLALAWRDGKQFKGKGAALLKLAVHSADLHGFQTTGSLTLTEADVRVPGAVAEGIQGDLPFAVDFTLDAKGLRPVRTARVNPYALLRFQDQHPLLKAQSFLTMRKLSTPQVTLAPFAANVQVSQSVLYLSQLETGLSGGVITGELMIDMNEKDPRARANVRATGIKSEGGDVFTGNAALAISLRDHSVDGRAEVLEISKRQLLILLDMSDPHHTSASTNRIRQVLEFGYPERLHILFNHGFASAKVTFGGPASLVQLDELRGIPVESLLDRYLFTGDDPEEGT